MRYRNYKSYSNKSTQMTPNIISESIVDYFINLNITHPFHINTTKFGKLLNIHVPTTNLIDLKDYLFQENFDLMRSSPEINFFQQKQPFYSDILNYGNYYGYSIKNEYNDSPIGKHISDLIVKSLSEYHSHICQLTYDVTDNVIVSLTLITTDKNVTIRDINLLINEHINDSTKINIIPNYEMKDEFTTNNDNIIRYFELPSTNNHFFGSDPSSPNRVLPLYLRYIAKNIVNSNLMDECLISVNYSQNSTVPLSLNINGFGTEKYSMKNIYSCVMDVFPLSLKQIKEEMNFNQPFYRHSAENNYINLDNVPWEKLDKSQELIIF
jgi:hypothetical protein